MKGLNMLVWLTQLGLSTALPLAGFILLGLWLRSSCGWGEWVIWAGITLGVITAAEGFYSSLKAMSRMAKGEQEEPPVSFNDHD